MTDYSTYPHMTEEEFYSKCESIAYKDDYFRENDEYIDFCNVAGCKLVSFEKQTGIYREF